MRKLIAGFTSLVVGISMFAGVAVAQTQNCEINNTGPDSNNTCSVNTEQKCELREYEGNNPCNFTSGKTCKVVNNTLVSIEDVTVQGAQSGEAIVVQNSNGGSANSGNANNNNSNVTTVGVTNGSACVVPATTETPAEGGMGAGVTPTSTSSTQVSAPTGAVNAGVDSATNRTTVLAILTLAVTSAFAAAFRIRKANRL